MKRSILTALMAFAFGIGIALLTATSAMAVHKGSGDLTCGSCHTMHSSQGGTNSSSMGGVTGSFILLRTSIASRAEMHNFCLSCHSQDGAQGTTQYNTGLAATTPPKVHLNPAWDGANFSTIGAGGAFNGSYAGGVYTPDGLATNDLGGAGGTGTAAIGRQHSIGATTVTPPGNSTNNESIGTQSLSTLSCTSCHDPHGTNVTTNGINKYRNLKAGSYITTEALNNWSDMATFGDLGTSYVGGVNGGDNSQGTAIASGNTGNIWPVWRSSGTQNSYRTAAVTVTLGGTAIATIANAGTGNVGISAFCAQCHGAWHEARANGTASTNNVGADWRRHPVNNALVVSGSETSGAGVSIIDFGHYDNTGDTSRAPYTTTDATKLPAANVTNVTAARYYADSSDDKVFCLTCHFVHGSPYNDILRWNYTSAVGTGSQTGLAIASNVGCQQCHNR